MIPTRGAVFDGARLVVTDELLVREAGPGEAMVRVLASGICHSDLNVLDGARPVPLPVVLGHEAAGIVEQVGEGVSSVQPGDAVVVGSMVPCGVCRACADGRSGECRDAFGAGTAPFTWHGEAVRAYANVASFAGMITVRADQLVASADLPATSAALIGCAVSTGYGVVRNVARVRIGDTVVVFGVGGIGVNALQTARLEGAAQIVAVDVNPDKAATAARFGADTFVVAPRTADASELVGLVRARTAAPIDVVIECSGAPVAIDAAIRVTGWGGITALVGIPPADARASFDVSALLRNRRIVGSLNGTVDVQHDFAAIVASVQHGELELDAQVSRVWPLAEIDHAIATVRAGEVVRAVLDHTAL